MSHLHRPLPPLVLVALFAATAAQAAGTHSPAECAVWARELSFAGSVAAHDAAAFAEHVDPGAVFDAAGQAPTRGRDAILVAWKGLLAGDGVELAWYPTRTTVGSGNAATVAWSSGPFLVTAETPDGRKNRITGTFRSVWQKGADGIWHVLYDAGGDSRPATDADVEAFRAGRRETCPAD